MLADGGALRFLIPRGALAAAAHAGTGAHYVHVANRRRPCVLSLGASRRHGADGTGAPALARPDGSRRGRGGGRGARDRRTAKILTSTRYSDFK